MSDKKESSESQPEQIVRDRVKGSMPATRRLDVAMKQRRGVKEHLPRKEIQVDAREARRAIRWGKAEDHRVVALDQAMKNRRQVEKDIAQVVMDGLPRPSQKRGAQQEAAAKSRNLVMIMALIGAVVIVAMMVVVAAKFL